MKRIHNQATTPIKQTIVALTTTAAITFTTAPAVRNAMVKIGSMDVPNHRSSHDEPVPRGGGLACAIGIAGALILDKRRLKLLHSVLPAVIGLTITGLVDDQMRGTPVSVRLVSQALAGLAVADSSFLSSISSLFAMPAVVNVFNFMDGINGISAATAVLWGTTVALNEPSSEYPELRLIGALTAGAGLGFLPWNLPQAQLFLGDVGSYLIGSLIGSGVIISMRDTKLLRIVCAPLCPYFADASQALILRLSRRESITEAHREHTYQKLVDKGALTHFRAAAVHTFAAVACTLTCRIRTPRHAAASTTLITIIYLTSPYILSARSK